MREYIQRLFELRGLNTDAPYIYIGHKRSQGTVACTVFIRRGIVKGCEAI